MAHDDDFDEDDDSDMADPEFWLNTDFPPFPDGYEPSAEQLESLAMWEAATWENSRHERTFLRHPDPNNPGETTDLLLRLPMDYYAIDSSSPAEVVVRHKGIVQQELYRGPGPVELLRRKP